MGTQRPLQLTALQEDSQEGAPALHSPVLSLTHPIRRRSRSRTPIHAHTFLLQLPQSRARLTRVKPKQVNV